MAIRSDIRCPTCGEPMELAAVPPRPADIAVCPVCRLTWVLDAERIPRRPLPVIGAPPSWHRAIGPLYVILAGLSDVIAL